MILKPDAYGWTFRTEPGPYGLYLGQEPDNTFINTIAWYNQQGEYIGYGDLTQEQIYKLRDELPEGEVFVIVPWSKIDLLSVEARKALSVADLAKKATAAIRRGEILFRAPHDRPNLMYWQSKIEVRIVGPQTLEKVLTSVGA